MLSRLKDILLGTSRPTYPSVVLVLDHPVKAYVLHVVPESGATETLAFPIPPGTTLRHGRARERSREQLGSVSLRSGEYPLDFLGDIKARATQLLKEREKPNTADITADNNTAQSEEHALYAANQALRSAVAKRQEETAERQADSSGVEAYPIYLLQIDRFRAGKLVTEAEITSFPR